MLCDEELNYCEKNPKTCENGGKCASLMKEDGEFNCECPSGFVGKQCEVVPITMQQMAAANATEQKPSSTSIRPQDKDEEEKKTTTTEKTTPDMIDTSVELEEIDNEA